MKTILSLLQFTTILPLGKPQDFELFARRSYLYPVAGYLIGAVAALPVILISNQVVAAAISVAILFLITGAHHFDGLLDLGDGLMAHGDKEKRARALTDRNVGAGGIAAGIAVTLLLFAGLVAVPALAAAIIIGEVCAKFSMEFLTAFGKPFRQGIHSFLYKHAKPFFPVASAILCIPLFLLPVAPIKIFGAFIAMIVCPCVLILVSERLFGGVNGDVCGASNEITRACAVLVIALL